ncbi:MAG TPA: CapA family protein [Chitinophagales bacterium]|nr:CapA family protein [Chitinophagales bacterium]
MIATFFLWAGVLCAQNAKKSIINVKQRLLQRKPDEMHEKVDSFHTLHLMIGGNVYQTEEHIYDAYNTTTSRYDFSKELHYVQPILNLGDVTIVNLRTSFAGNMASGFSSPDEFALALKYAGITAIMHANQQTANINKATLQRTRKVLNDYDMYHTGAFADKMERMGNYPLIINKKGFKIAVLNYTYLPSRPQASREFFINEVDKTYIDQDMRMALINKPDFIIVYFNWGSDEQEIPNYIQQELAQYVFTKGANLVVGTCPNRPMRLDYTNFIYNSKPSEGIIAYSMGNLIASNEEIRNRNGYLIDMQLKKNRFSGETQIDDWGVIPVYTYYDTITTPGKTDVYSLPCWAVESGDIFKNIPYIEKRRVVNGAYEVRKMLGSTADEIQYNMNEQIVNNVTEAIHITNASINNKFSQAKPIDIPPSPPPVSASLIPGTYNTASLAKVRAQTESDLQTANEAKRGKGGKLENPDIFEAGKSSTETDTATAPVAENKNTKDSTAKPANIQAAKTDVAQNKKPAPESTVKTNGAANRSTPANPVKESNQAAPKEPATDNSTNAKENPYEAARRIWDGIDNNSTATADTHTQPVPEVVNESDTFYRIQFYALKTYLPIDTNYYTHLKGYEVVEENGYYKYLLGMYHNYEECYKYWKSQIQPRYKESFIVKYIHGKRALK